MIQHSRTKEAAATKIADISAAAILIQSIVAAIHADIAILGRIIAIIIPAIGSIRAILIDRIIGRIQIAIDSIESIMDQIRGTDASIPALRGSIAILIGAMDEIRIDAIDETRIDGIIERLNTLIAIDPSIESRI